MAVDYSEFKVELRRHVGVANGSFGYYVNELPQKYVLVTSPDGVKRHVGFFGDAPSAMVSIFPDFVDQMPPALLAHVVAECGRLKAAGEFTDPPESATQLPKTKLASV